MNGHAWFNLQGTHRSVRNWIQVKNSKWKYMSLLGIKPATLSNPTLTPFGHRDRCLTEFYHSFRILSEITRPCINIWFVSFKFMQRFVKCNKYHIHLWKKCKFGLRACWLYMSRSMGKPTTWSKFSISALLHKNYLHLLNNRHLKY